MTALPETLRRLRTERGLSRAEVSRRAGLQRATYTHYEQGRHEPVFSVLVRLADALEVDVSRLAAEARG